MYAFRFETIFISHFYVEFMKCFISYETAFQRSSLVVNYHLTNLKLIFRMLHKFSIGLSSGEQDSHFIKQMSLKTHFIQMIISFLQIIWWHITVHLSESIWLVFKPCVPSKNMFQLSSELKISPPFPLPTTSDHHCYFYVVYSHPAIAPYVWPIKNCTIFIGEKNVWKFCLDSFCYSFYLFFFCFFANR